MMMINTDIDIKSTSISNAIASISANSPITNGHLPLSLLIVRPTASRWNTRIVNRAVCGSVRSTGERRAPSEPLIDSVSASVETGASLGQDSYSASHEHWRFT